MAPPLTPPLSAQAPPSARLTTPPAPRSQGTRSSGPFASHFHSSHAQLPALTSFNSTIQGNNFSIFNILDARWIPAQTTGCKNTQNHLFTQVDQINRVKLLDTRRYGESECYANQSTWKTSSHVGPPGAPWGGPGGVVGRDSQTAHHSWWRGVGGHGAAISEAKSCADILEVAKEVVLTVGQTTKKIE